MSFDYEPRQPQRATSARCREVVRWSTNTILKRVLVAAILIIAVLATQFGVMCLWGGTPWSLPPNAPKADPYDL